MKNPTILILIILIFPAARAHAQVAITTIPTGSASDAIEPGQRQVKRNFTHRDLPSLNLDMFEISTQTGGDFYFWGEGEFGSEAASQVIAGSVLSTEALLYDYGDLDGKREIPFAVGEYQYHLTFFAGIQSKDSIAFIQPDGTALSADEDGVTVHSFQRMLIATVNAPAAGEWTIRVNGRGKYLVTVRK